MVPKIYLALEAIAQLELIKPTDIIIWDEGSNIQKDTFEKWLELSFDFDTLSNNTSYVVTSVKGVN